MHGRTDAQAGHLQRPGHRTGLPAAAGYNPYRTRAKQLLQAALRMEEAEPVRKLMASTLDDMGLGGLVHPGR